MFFFAKIRQSFPKKLILYQTFTEQKFELYFLHALELLPVWLLIFIYFYVNIPSWYVHQVDDILKINILINCILNSTSYKV